MRWIVHGIAILAWLAFCCFVPLADAQEPKEQQAVLAGAPQRPTVDPRIAGPLINALQAEVALKDAAIKAMKEDQEKRETDLRTWFEGWFAAPSGESK